MENADRLDRKEFILNGNMYKVIMVLSSPIILNNIVQTLYGLVDAIWVSRLGSVQFAATSFVWPIIFLFVCLGIGASIAGTSILSQLIGASKYDEANSYAGQLVIISIIVSICFAALGYLLSPYIIKLMGGAGDLAKYGDTYLKICFLGFPFIFLFFSFNSIMTAQGNTLAPTIISVIAAIINVVLDPVFIFTFKMGVAGAAIATVLAQVIASLVGVYVFIKYSPIIRPSFKQFKFDKKKLKKIIKVGLPASIGQSGTSLGFVVLYSFIGSYGTATLAAFSMVDRITSLVIQPAMGIGAGLTSIVGQNIGANQPERVYEAFKKSIIITLSILIIGLTLLLWKDIEVINIFMKSKDDIEVINQGLVYFKYMTLTMPFMGLFSIFQGLFQGSGHTKYSMSMDIIRLWVIRVPLLFFFKHFTNLGPIGPCISMILSNFLVCIYGYIIYRTDKWKTAIINIES